MILGLLLVVGGAGAAALFGSDGSLSTAPARVSGKGVALVIEDIAIDASSIPVPDGVGTLSLSVADPSGRSMFVGSASSSDVDGYLVGAPYDVVVDVAAGTDGTTRAVPGTQQPPPPEAQTFWIRQATGRPAELTARVGPSSTLVVMRSDASAGVTADLVVTLTVASVWTYSWIAVGVGVLLLLLAVVAFWRARVAHRSARDRAALTAPSVAVVAAPGPTVLPGAATRPAVPVAPVEPPTQIMPAVVVASPSSTPVAPAAAAAAAATVTSAADRATEPETPGLATGATASPGDVGAEPPTSGVDPAAAVVASLAASRAADAQPAHEGPPTAPVPVVAPAEHEEPEQSEPGQSEPEAGARPVDMAALFAPSSSDDDTALIPVVPAPGASAGGASAGSGPATDGATPERADPATTGPVAAPETDSSAG